MTSFPNQIMDAGSLALETALQIMRVAAGNLCDSVVDKTPVLTGNLQSGWRGTTEEGDIAEFGIRDVANIVSAGETKSKVRAAIERWDGIRPFFLHDPVIYGPLIEYLGHSAKAPQGMVRISAAMWPLFVRDAVNQVGGL